MKKHLIVITLALALGACKKSGSSSTSTDIADGYTGNYIVKDTVVSTDPNGTTTTYNTRTGSIVKTGSTSIRLRNMLFATCDSLSASVSATSIAPVSDAFCSGGGFPQNFVGSKSGNTITFSFSNTTFGQYGYTVRGKAEKQP